MLANRVLRALTRRSACLGLRTLPMVQAQQRAFSTFDLGDINIVQSTPDHKPPIVEDTIEGRYSGVLFTTAS